MPWQGCSKKLIQKPIENLEKAIRALSNSPHSVLEENPFLSCIQIYQVVALLREQTINVTVIVLSPMVSGQEISFLCVRCTHAQICTHTAPVVM